MDMMKTYILSFFATILLFVGCKGNLEPNDAIPFSYQLNWNNAGIDVILDCTCPQHDTLELYYCEPDLGGQTDLFSCMKNLNADGCNMTTDSTKCLVRLYDFQRTTIRLTYRIEQSLPDTDLDCPKEVFRPNLTDDVLYALSTHLFLLPDMDDEVLSQVPMCVKWGEKPDFPVFCLYNPGNGLNDYEGQLYELYNTVVVGDRFLHVDTAMVMGTTNYIVTAPRRYAEFNNADLKAFFKFFYPASVRFWEDVPEKPYSLMVYPFQKIPFEVSGLGLDGGFFGRYSADADTILNHEREQTYAHEIGHNWIGFGEDFQWFGEGFNDFQAIYLVTASGLKDTQNFVDFFNDYLDKLHHSEIRNLPNDEIWKNFWNLGDYSWIPYWRGAVYALHLTGWIEAVTGTEHAFKDLMMAVKPSMDTLTPESFLDIAGQFVDRQQLEEDFNRYILRAETMTLDGDPMPKGCEVRRKDDGTLYLIITDEKAFARHFVL